MSKLKSSNRHIERDALRAFLDADEVGMADESQQAPAFSGRRTYRSTGAYYEVSGQNSNLKISPHHTKIKAHLLMLLLCIIIQTQYKMPSKCAN
jgi:hypothetical protein